MRASTSSIILAAFAAVVSAQPTDKLEIRAGGPMAKPIPDSCTVTNPLETLSPDHGYVPNASAKAALLYNAYFASSSSDTAAEAKFCLEQCNGYGHGYGTDCKAAYYARNVEVPPTYYNSPPGNFQTACIMFSRELTAANFDQAPAGQGTDAVAGNIHC
jgi:hypothetical protein